MGRRALEGKVCSTCNVYKTAESYTTRRVEGVIYLFSECKPCKNSGTRRYRNASPEARLLSSARARAKRTGKEFTLTIDDVVVPEKCPVLGIPLHREFVKRKNSTPSLDRIDNTRGYVSGNVVVVSWRANRLKSDASIEELRKIAEFYTH